MAPGTTRDFPKDETTPNDAESDESTPVSRDTTTGSSAAVHEHTRPPATEVPGPPEPTHEADTDKVTAGTVAPATRHEFRRFVRWFLGIAVLLLACVVGFNAYVDPFGVTPSDRYTPVVQNTTDRQAKLALIDRLDDAPDSLILGSSRVLKLDPAYIEKSTGTTAFNAGLSSARPQESFVFASYMGDKFEGKFPHLVWGLDIEQFREKPVGGESYSGVLLREPELRQYLPREDQWKGLADMYRPLVEWQTTKVSLRVVREAKVQDVSEERQINRLIQRDFAASGFRKRDLHDRAFARGATLQPRMEKQVEGYERSVWGPEAPEFDGLGATPTRWIEQAIQLANDRGDEPTIFLTTVHPFAQARYGERGWNDRKADVEQYFETLQEKGLDFQLLDYTSVDSFGGDPNLFYDGVHLQPPNLQRLVDDLAKRGAFLTQAKK